MIYLKWKKKPVFTTEADSVDFQELKDKESIALY